MQVNFIICNTAYKHWAVLSEKIRNKYQRKRDRKTKISIILYNSSKNLIKQSLLVCKNDSCHLNLLHFDRIS